MPRSCDDRLFFGHLKKCAIFRPCQPDYFERFMTLLQYLNVVVVVLVTIGRTLKGKSFISYSFEKLPKKEPTALLFLT
jgi:hypothetical protein